MYYKYLYKQASNLFIFKMSLFDLIFLTITRENKYFVYK